LEEEREMHTQLKLAIGSNDAFTHLDIHLIMVARTNYTRSESLCERNSLQRIQASKEPSKYDRGNYGRREAVFLILQRPCIVHHVDQWMSERDWSLIMKKTTEEDVCAIIVAMNMM
jgi:hypothetical protein